MIGTGKKGFTSVLAALLALAVLTSCTVKESTADSASDSAVSSVMTSLNHKKEQVEIDDKNGTTYEVFLYSFADSDGDGIGDINGLISKLDYIDDFGADAIWILPVCPSPTYHKYDVKDYMDIDPQYGTMEDFENLIAESHERNIKIYTDLVLNHTSSEHPWFLAAKEYLTSLGDNEPSSDECKYFDYYSFSKEKKEGYEPLEGTDWYYEARFWGGMPDLNLDNENVRKEIEDIVKFWLDKGVDGFRLDAVTSYYTGNSDKNIAFLSWLNETVKGVKSDAYLVAECWTDFASYTSYYQSGVDSFFDFAFSDSTGALANYARGTSGIINYGNSCLNVQNTLKKYNENAVDAPFTSNHDQARCAGYYTGENADKQIRLAGGLLLMMNGNAFIYYGEELGMKGSGKDENKRAPMQWGDESITCGGPVDMDEIEMTYGTLADQQSDPYSIYNYYKEAAYLRKAWPEIARGEITVESSLSNNDVLVMFKTYEEHTIAIVVNSSEEAMDVDLSSIGEAELAGMLVMDENPVTFENGTIHLPAYSIAILE